jgi:hypothetical protein
MQQKQETKSKYWCFTINNPADGYADIDNAKGWSYCIIGDEVGEEGTPHHQGFIAYPYRIRFSTLKKQLPKAHIEPLRSTTKNAINYCKKDGHYIEFGEPPLDTTRFGGASGGNQKKANYQKMIDLAKNGELDKIAEVDPVCYVQHYHSFKRIIQDNPASIPDLGDVCGEWIYGETGIGKSRTARAENEDIYDKPCNKWWDGYRGEETVLIDDFDKNHVVLGHHLKRWGDRYSFPAEQKGTTVQIRPKKVVVTSNYSIEEIFVGDEALIQALKRRYKERHLVVPFQ